MNFTDLFKNYSKSVISSQILKSPYEEIYNQIFLNRGIENILIINQGVYVPLKPFFKTILKDEIHITYIDENELSINQLNNDLLQFKNNETISNNIDNLGDKFKKPQNIDIYIETLLSNIYNLKNNRFKNVQYDIILIHHLNSYLSRKEDFFNILKMISHKETNIILFASICNESNSINYKNKIRMQMSNITKMSLGMLYSLEDIILSIPQNDFKIKHIIPYRESHYIGYGKNIIYKFILSKE